MILLSNFEIKISCFKITIEIKMLLVAAAADSGVACMLAHSPHTLSTFDFKTFAFMLECFPHTFKNFAGRLGMSSF